MTREPLDAYLRRAVDLFESARSRAAGAVTRTCLLGARPLRIACAGDTLAGRILPALDHHPAWNGEPELTVMAWDAASSDTWLPPPPWESVVFHERGNTRTFDDDRFSMTFDRPTDAFSLVDGQAGMAVYWTRDAARLPAFDTAAPMRRLLQGWLRHHRQYVVHAAAIGTPAGGLLLAGRGGAGKSTTAMLSLLRPGLQYAGDDFCLVQAEPDARIFSLYSTAKLNRDALERLPALAGAVSNRDRLDREKALLFLRESHGPALAHQFPLRAVVLPRVAGREATEVLPASAFDAYRAIGPDTALRTLGDTRGLLAMLKTLVHARPCYRLELGTDPDGVHRALLSLLEER